MSARPSVRLHVSAWLPLNKFSWIWYWRFHGNLSRNSGFDYNWTKISGFFYIKIWVRFIVDNITKYFVARQQCKGKQLLYFCVHTSYFWNLHEGQQYKWNTCCVSMATIVARMHLTVTLYLRCLPCVERESSSPCSQECAPCTCREPQ